ncbi:MAG: adenylate kinase [Salinivirgaceae bacterium]|nr:adenylate kinase [Salinivirgaceae bacterium]
MLNIALFGPPGAGKGTQSKQIVEKYKLFYISTGDILRREIAEETKLGLEAKNIIASGGLVSDEIIVQIIENTIKENHEAKGFLFDGFPRTYVQAYILEGLMIKLNTSLNCLISMEVEEEESVNRLLERGRESGRSDDNVQVIRKRLKEYNDKTLPVLEYYKDRGIYYGINGIQSIDAVGKGIDKILQDELSKSLLNIVLYGYPGSRRGKLGKAIAAKYGLEYVSTGKMLELEIREQTEIGQKIKDYYVNGRLVPDEIVIQLIEQKIEASKGAKGFIFKGYPRTLVQSYILDGLLRKHGASVSEIIEIEMPTLEVIARLDERSKTEYAKPYDNSTAKIVNRLKQYEKRTVPVIEKYNQMYGVKKLDGMGSYEEVLERLSSEIEKIFKKN